MTAPALLHRSAGLLREMYDEDLGLFAYSTRLRDGAYVHDFENPGRLRYTVNTLAGLVRTPNLGWDVGGTVEAFVRRWSGGVTNPGDRGLLLRGLTEAGHDAARGLAGELIATSAGDRRLNAQERSWCVLGLASHAAATGNAASAEAAVKVAARMREELVAPGTALPSHERSRLRRGLTSFGAVAYYLAAQSEAGHGLGDAEAAGAFDAGLAEVLALQGPRGEWPWFIDVRRRRVVDWYQLYSVHQDAMAMLFLLPALDRGAPVEDAIRRSYRWLFGQNELGVPMVSAEPFFIDRSIRRPRRFERARRFARGRLSRARAEFAPAARLEVNRECRSYHLGWILYAWAGRNDFPELTGLELLAT